MKNLGSLLHCPCGQLGWMRLRSPARRPEVSYTGLVTNHVRCAYGHQGKSQKSLTLAVWPIRLDAFTGTSGYLAVSIWIYQMEQYFSAIEFTSRTTLAEVDKVVLAPTLLKDSAVKWWFTLQEVNALPENWTASLAAMIQ